MSCGERCESVKFHARLNYNRVRVEKGIVKIEIGRIFSQVLERGLFEKSLTTQ